MCTNGICRENSLKEAKRKAVKTARDFGYGKNVVEEIEAAETLGEISTIMRRARG